LLLAFLPRCHMDVTEVKEHRMPQEMILKNRSTDR